MTLTVGDRTFTATHQYLDDGASPGNGMLIDNYTISVTIVDTFGDELAGLWTFDADNATDDSGNNNDGTVGSGMSFSADAPTAIGGKSLAGTGAGGSSGYVSVPNSANLEAIDDQMTLSFWMKADGAANQNWFRIIRKGNEVNGATSWMITRHSGNDDTLIRTDTVGGGGAFNQNRHTGQGLGVLDNQWHHIAYVLDSGSTMEYVDGTLTSSTTYPHGNGLSNTQPLLIGGRGSGNIVGNLDDVALFGRAFTAAEIARFAAHPASAIADAVATSSTILTVSNVPPVGTVTMSATDEDSPTNIDILVGATDVGTLDVLTLSAVDAVSTGGGTVADNLNGTVTYDPNGQFEYLPDGITATDTFSYTVSDDDTGTNVQTITVTITGVNDAPTANPDAAAEGAVTTEAAPVTIDVLANDTDPDIDGNAPDDMLSVAAVDDTGTLGTVTNNTSDIDYDPNGQFEYLGVGDSATDSFKYTARDIDGLTSTATVTVTINGQNDAPVLSVPGPQAGIVEGAVFDLSTLVSFTDLDLSDTHTVTIDWGEGGATESGTTSETPGAAPATPDTFAVNNTHRFADDGTYTVTITVDDGEALGVDTDSFSVTVVNALPTLVLAVSAQDEATPFTLTNLGVITDAGFDNASNPNGASVETFTYSIDWGDGSAVDTGTATVDDVGGTTPGDLTDASLDGSHTYDDDGVYTVTVRVADDDMSGDFVTGVDGVDFVEMTIMLTVNNLPPTGLITGPTSASPSETLHFTFSGDDPSPVDDTTLDCNVDWGDGSPTENLGNCFTLAPVMLTHEYNALNTYVISLLITDDSGVPVVVDTHSVNVTNDPRIDANGNLLVPDSLDGSNSIIITDTTGGGQLVLRNDIGYGPFYPTTGTVIVITGDGPDRIVIASNRICGDIDAGGGDNYIAGSGCNDNIVTTDGDDIIISGRGDDVVNAGDGDNKVDGGEGNDTLTAGGGRDELLGRAGDDVINAGGGNDLVAGDTGDDVLRGGDGDDTMSGGGDNDIVLGEAGNDRLFGRQGRDIVIGGFGADDVQGNDDDDIVGGGELAFTDLQLIAIRNEWTGSGNDFSTRVTNVLTGLGLASGNRLDSIMDDVTADGLIGHLGQDLYLANGTDQVFAVRSEDSVQALP